MSSPQLAVKHLDMKCRILLGVCPNTSIKKCVDIELKFPDLHLAVCIYVVYISSVSMECTYLVVVASDGGFIGCARLWLDT